ncbi:MAG: hypothetical protein OSB09_07425 [Planctomycetota bacterium]|nr:hypothetical protein [Planctomycetota bacterium]
MRIDQIGRLSLVPLGLSLVLWIVPLSSSSPDAVQNPTGSGTVVETHRWLPGFELPLLGLASSLLILSVLRAQQRLEGHARQMF